MKNSIKIFFLASFLYSFFSAHAQAPQVFSYQAIIRNASNALVVNTTIGMRVSVLQASAAGNAMYVETHNPTTNANGLATIQIGGGTLAAGSFTNINWASGTYFIKTETDITGGNNYTIIATSQLLSVPYALSSADNKWETSNTNDINNKNTGNVGIGTNQPVYKLHVGNSANAMRVEGPSTATGGRALSIGGYGKIEVDAPGLQGGRFNIQDNGNVGIGMSSQPTQTGNAKLVVNGFTKLGFDAPAIQVIKLTGTTANAQNGNVSISLGGGLISSKILSITVLVEFSPGLFVPHSFLSQNGYQFDFNFNNAAIFVYNHNGNSANILSKPIKILITYEP